MKVTVLSILLASLCGAVVTIAVLAILLAPFALIMCIIWG